MTQKGKHKVAAIQMCSTHDLDENLRQAQKLIGEAARNGAKLVVLPENFSQMGNGVADKLSVQEMPGHGKIQDFLSRTAKDNRIWIVGGTISLTANSKQKVRAACLLYNDKGELTARYDKIHLFDAIVSAQEQHKESSMVEAGNEIVVSDSPVGKIGFAICFDLRFPELFKALAKKGTEIFVIPAAFTQKTGEAHWEILTRCRAIDTFSYVIAAGQCGEHTNGRETYGHSMIIDPWGKVLAEQANDKPGIIYGEIDPALIQKARHSIPLVEKIATK